MIELRDVSKTVMSGTEPLTILHPLSLQIPRGQFVAIVGPSGSGKSTLLGLIAGLDAPTSGAVLIDGVDITRLDEDALAQAARREDRLRLPVLSPDSVADRATRTSRCRWRSPASPTRGARAEQLLEEVGLTGRAHHYPSQLSGGEQQRVALARALANDPPIVLADEPTGNLDTANGRHIMDLLRTIHAERGTTIVLVTHDAELAAMADARLVLRDGRVVENTLMVDAQDERDRTLVLTSPSRATPMMFVLRMAVRETRASLAAPAVLLRLHRRRRRGHRRAAVGDSERPRRLRHARRKVADRRRRR